MPQMVMILVMKKIKTTRIRRKRNRKVVLVLGEELPLARHAATRAIKKRTTKKKKKKKARRMTRTKARAARIEKMQPPRTWIIRFQLVEVVLLVLLVLV